MEISLENASMAFSGFSITGLSLSFGPGLTALTGRSGSGKTTILVMLSGLRKLDGGCLLLGGAVQNGHPHSVSMVFQYPERQLFAETVFADVSFALRRSGLGRQEKDERTASILRMMEIPEKLWAAPPFSLSGGERRRVAIASSVVTDPDVILMDEPTVGLDAASYEIVMGLLHRFCTEGKTVVMATHDDEAASWADRVIAIENGRVVKDGSPDDILDTACTSLSVSLGLERTCSISYLADGIAGLIGGRK